jgi:hypothetical protein
VDLGLRIADCARPPTSNSVTSCSMLSRLNEIDESCYHGSAFRNETG